ncbi:MAG TPA: ATP-NAD kinase family protein [Clostridia bacterium]|nr:ATP-NAD kinase family protein [Clostridia bacterium]
MVKKKLGLIINPIAGIGGRVGLKGSDGIDVLQKAKEMGAVPLASFRTSQALKELLPIHDQIELITYPVEMGETEAKKCGFSPRVIGKIQPNQTKPEDTRRAAQEMLSLGVDLILFSGGDGTARDIHDAVGDGVVTLGIPAGVKIHSAVYGVNPQKSGELARLFLEGKTKDVQEVEVMDIDEEAVRDGRIFARLYGYLTVPYEKRFVQNLKSGSVMGEKRALHGISCYLVHDVMIPDWLFLIGPGTTTRPIMEELGLPNTLLGIDAVMNRQLLAGDVNETKILELLDRFPKAKIVVTTIGGQGYVFGRGNQQFSPQVLQRIGKQNIIVVTTREKLNANFGAPFLVDTGDEEIDRLLSGYYEVIVGDGERAMYKVTY